MDLDFDNQICISRTGHGFDEGDLDGKRISRADLDFNSSTWIWASRIGSGSQELEVDFKDVICVSRLELASHMFWQMQASIQQDHSKSWTPSRTKLD